MSDDDEPGAGNGGTRLVIRDFDPELHQRLKVLAAMTRTSMKEIVTAGAVHECERRELKMTSPEWPGGGTAAAAVAAGTAATGGPVPLARVDDVAIVLDPADLAAPEEAD